MTHPPVEVAAGVHRLGSPLINCYLLEEGGRLTLVDAGLPGFRGQLDAHLRAIGHVVADIDAVLLTHAHTDHVGMADGVRRDAGAPVLVHTADAAMARTGKPHKREGSLLPHLRHRAVWKLFGAAIRGGGLRTPKVAEVETFDGATELDVPGHPRVIPTPGHSPGHVAFHLPDRGVLLVGDALCTYNPLTGATGPQLMPRAFAFSARELVESLDALEPLRADVLLPGHGEPWRDGVAEAVARARAIGQT